jgi:hypothetical protein
MTGRRDAPTLAQARGCQGREWTLSEYEPPAEGTDAQDAVLLFVGGPLDGRVEIRAARHGEPLPTITHVHLHGGPKVVHRYDLESLTDQAGVYHLRQPDRRSARDERSAEDRSAN